MKQLIQNLRNGDVAVVDVPRPEPPRNGLLVRTTRTLISPGTERMLAEFGRATLAGKVMQQPERVRQVLDKVRTDGPLSTIESVRSQLERSRPLGYANVGVVCGVGPGRVAFEEGDRVVSNGPHAEVVCVPRTLCARVPDGVSDEHASFTVPGAIGLQGVRLVDPTLGECFVVTGLGLIGLLTVQILRANGCRVLGIDLDPSRLALARRFGAETVDLSNADDPLGAADLFSRGRGVDGVILTAATRSNEPVSQAARMCRKRGRIVLVGVTGMELSRSDFYEKELTFQVSCSYGPGRYDPAYEEGAQDYPIGFVRWTEQRNFEAVLDMLAAGTLDVEPLVTHRLPIERAPEAYELLTSGASSLGIILQYPESGDGGVSASDRTVQLGEVRAAGSTEPAVSFIGAGNYAARILVPAFRKAGARLRSIATTRGINGVHVGRKFGFEETTTDLDHLFEDTQTSVIVVATPHDSHAALAARALQGRKHVFVEKPLAITAGELQLIEDTYRTIVQTDGEPPLLMVGFNRRFAPHVVRVRELLAGVRGPKTFVATVNAGAVPGDHWVQDPERGGGRIVGEACHFIDLLRHLADHPIVGWGVTPVRLPERVVDDASTLVLTFADGSHGTIHYFSNGHRAFPKERLEVFAGGRILQIDNFRRLRGHGWGGLRGMRFLRQDKGNDACAAAFVKAVREGGPAPIPFEEIIEVSRVAVALAEAARTGGSASSTP